MTNETHPSERVRRRRRSSSGGFGLNDTTEARGTDIEEELETPDHNLNDEVVALAQLDQSQQRFQPPQPGEQEDFTPRNRMDDVRKRGGAYEREYRLQLLHRMLMRRVPLDEIARELDISVHTILKDRQELYTRLRDAAKKLDINQLIGDTLGFFGEIQGMALRAASLKKSPINIRLAAMRTALSSRNDQHKFLQAAGVFDVLRYRMHESDSSSDLSKLMELTESIVNSEEEDIESTAKELDLGEDFTLEKEDDIEIHLF